MKRLPTAAALLCTFAVAGCTSVVCGEGTESKFDPNSGATTCTGKIPDHYVQCDPNTTRIEGGVCVGDPAKFPHCGLGTMQDATLSCVPLPSTCGHMPPTCTPQPGKFAVAGVITHFKDGKFADGEMVEVRAYDPIAFIKNTSVAPQQKVTTTNSTYCLDDLSDTSGQGLIAIAITDPGNVNWMLAGVGQNSVAPKNTYRVDGYIIEKSLIAAWDAQAGLSGMDTLEAVGAYVARFFDKPRLVGVGEDPTEKGVAGVSLIAGFSVASDAYYFKGDLSTIDKSAMLTDGATGSVVERTAGLTPFFTGKMATPDGGAPINWERFPGGSAPGVVFVQTFHPQAM